MDLDRHPSFKRPPVVETVLGVQFDLLPKFRNAHLGAFWKSQAADWPKTIDAPPLEPQFERFADEVGLGFGMQVMLTQDPACRIQILNADNDRMIQLQNGRLHYNWLGHSGREYPRYRQVRPEFDAVLQGLQEFLASESLGEMRANQWEVTYVNLIPRHSVWESPSDWAGLFRGPLCMPPSARAARLESFGGEWHFEIEPRAGRLHVQIGHGRHFTADRQEVLRLTLTARGPIKGKEQDGLSLEDGLDRGHSTIVRAFAEITSERAHQYWERDDEHS